MVFFPDPDTGYCEDEASYLDYLHEIEVDEQDRQARIDAEAERSGVDPETDCTADEMREEEKLPEWMAVERSK